MTVITAVFAVRPEAADDRPQTSRPFTEATLPAHRASTPRIAGATVEGTQWSEPGRMAVPG